MVTSAAPSGKWFEGTPKVAVTRHLVPEVEARMTELFDVTLNRADHPLSREKLKALMQSAHVLVPTVTDKIDAALIAEAGDQLKLIANYGAGTEHIDLKAAAARKIMVTNTPGVLVTIILRAAAAFRSICSVPAP